MIQQQEIYCLALHPSSGQSMGILRNELLKHLALLELLGEPFEIEEYSGYKLGNRFYQLLSFMGCSPALKLEPEQVGDKKFCHFRFVEFSEIQLRYLRPEVKARCPHCRKPSDTVVHIQQLNDDEKWSCPHCKQVSAVQNINWKHEAGISQFFIELVDVHPHEVVPTEGFLKELENITGQKWNYFYTATQL